VTNVNVLNSQAYPNAKNTTKSTSHAARLKNYLTTLMQQQSWILSKKPIFIILHSVSCFSFHFTLAIEALVLLNLSLYSIVYIILFLPHYVMLIKYFLQNI